MSNNGLSKYVVIIVWKTLPLPWYAEKLNSIGFRLQIAAVWNIRICAAEIKEGNGLKTEICLWWGAQFVFFSWLPYTSTTKNKTSSVSVLSTPAPPTPHPSTPLLPRNSTSWTHCPLPLHPEGFDQVPETPKYTPPFPPRRHSGPSINGLLSILQESV